MIDFGAGEPDFGHAAPPSRGLRTDALRTPSSRSTRPSRGSPSCGALSAIANKTDYGVEYTELQVILTAGGKQALYNTALTLFGPGDEVITHPPYWPTIVEQIKLADATPVDGSKPDTGDGFAIHADAIIRAITPRTRGIVINSPCNPTGALISEDALGAHRRRGSEARISGW